MSLNRVITGGQMLVEIGRYGRLVLSKTLREKYGVGEGSKLLISGMEDRIELIPR
ncbi:MAG: AbrB/MazE/SpoVT family DNA-binding domain-containing protein [Theionarchaea archaeon]|nr:AbrB/MazE/SpoVT family DNA-binding domain-containing protein [Theionarchaea archaeon]